MATDAASIKNEIARLTASISQHKAKPSAPARYPYPAPASSSSSYHPSRSSTYINPNYKPANKYIRPTSSAPAAARPSPSAASTSSNSINASANPSGVKEVVLNGVAFESSTRSLVRKDLPKPASAKPKPPSTAAVPSRPHTRPFPPQRVYKPKSSRGRGRGRGRGRPGNMTLTNSRRPYQSAYAPLHLALVRILTRGWCRSRPKRQKSDKPCPRFSTTGTCTRGLTCPYTHDPATTAICWPFLSGTCPLPAAQCALSHDPTPERTPLCTHFLAGSCTRPSCPFPHVNLGPRPPGTTVCRDFAVLGYCKLGLECDKAHVRECPDFAESGTCERKGCRLPHVIRAAGARKLKTDDKAKMEEDADKKAAAATATAEMGDEFISLTFNESSEEDESDEDESSEEEEDEASEEEDDDADDADGGGE
ncbi:hypothetical protein DFH06DRAFT_1473635 [Mycena polygramma]|nr:hypothetical protein DFH06DRAFT_1473635 [Mycena polygramma]